MPNNSEKPISIIIGMSIECGAKASDNVIIGGNNIIANQNSCGFANWSLNKIKNTNAAIYTQALPAYDLTYLFFIFQEVTA